MRAAAACKGLRNADLEDARKYRVLRDRCTDADARRFMERKLRASVKAARVWQREMLSALKHIRIALQQRRTPALLAARAHRVRGLLDELRLDERIRGLVK